jgi:hypothetical protein
MPNMMMKRWTGEKDVLWMGNGRFFEANKL